MSQAIARDGREALIATYELSKRFRGALAVDRAEFSVMPGDVFGLLGPNGAGKTTIIRMLLGLVKPSVGRAVLFGQDIASHKADILHRTSAIVEAPALYPHLDGWDNLRVMALSAGVNDQQRMREVLDQMGLTRAAKQKFRTYSLGMKQRLCIAAALLTNPQLIILDEPTNGLDPAGMRDIRELIKMLSEQGRTVLLSSHLLNEVQQVCNRVAIIERGRIIAQGVVEELLAAHSYVQLRVHPSEMERAVGLLRSLNWVQNLHQEGDYLVVDGQANQGAALNQTLGQGGIFASEIIPRNLSLEEYFLSVTGQNAVQPQGQPQTNPMPSPMPMPGPPPTFNKENPHA